MLLCDYDDDGAVINHAITSCIIANDKIAQSKSHHFIIVMITEVRCAYVQCVSQYYQLTI